MRTAVQQTSINAYYSAVVPHFEPQQEGRIVEYINKHGPSTIGEIAKGLGMEKSTVSARQNKLRADGILVFGIHRKCSISGVTCKPLRLPVVQRSLF